jgi:hypothetical protein
MVGMVAGTAVHAGAIAGSFVPVNLMLDCAPDCGPGDRLGAVFTWLFVCLPCAYLVGSAGLSGTVRLAFKPGYRNGFAYAAAGWLTLGTCLLVALLLALIALTFFITLPLLPDYVFLLLLGAIVLTPSLSVGIGARRSIRKGNPWWVGGLVRTADGARLSEERS